MEYIDKTIREHKEKEWSKRHSLLNKIEGEFEIIEQIRDPLLEKYNTLLRAKKTTKSTTEWNEINDQLSDTKEQLDDIDEKYFDLKSKKNNIERLILLKEGDNLITSDELDEIENLEYELGLVY